MYEKRAYDTILGEMIGQFYQKSSSENKKKGPAIVFG